MDFTNDSGVGQDELGMPERGVRALLVTENVLVIHYASTVA